MCTISTTAISAWATVVIAMFTIVLGIVSTIQACLLNKEFISTHRPRIRIKHLWLKSDIWSGEKIKVVIVIVNSGDTPAIVGAIKCITHVVNPTHGFTADLLNGVQAITITKNIRAGDCIAIELPGKETLTAADIAGMKLGKLTRRARRLYCIGDIQYENESGKIMKTAFCRRWEFQTYPVNITAIKGRFIMVENEPDYEYQD
jgi:hypothetical protein